MNGGSNATLWLGLYNAVLLLGILVGYVVGAIADSTRFVSWRHLYAFEGAMMCACGVVSMFFDRDLLQVSRFVVDLEIPTPCGGRFIVVGSGGGGVGGGAVTGYSASSAPTALSQQDSEKESLLSTSASRQAPDAKQRSGEGAREGPTAADDSDAVPPGVGVTMMQVLDDPLYIWTVFTGAIISGGVCFILYFVTQALEELSFFSQRNTFIVVGAIFVLSPIPGSVVGAWFLQRKGGYRNFSLALRFTVAFAATSFFGCVILSVSALLKVSSLYIISFYIYLFMGAAPMAAINGKSMSVTRQAGRQAGRHAGRQAENQSVSQTVRRSGRQAVNQSVRQAVNQAVRQSGSESGSQAVRQ